MNYRLHVGNVHCVFGHAMSILNCNLPGFYLEILFWGGNMVDKDSKKGHNTLLCIYSRGICYRPALAFNIHTPYVPGVLLKIG